MLTFTFYIKKIMERETIGRDGLRPNASWVNPVTRVSDMSGGRVGLIL